MRIDTRKAVPQTVTIINRLKREDSATGQDVWFKHELKACVWNSQTTSQQAGTQTNIGAYVSVEIPSAINDDYMPYSTWKSAGAQSEGWTVSANDYIVLGEVSEALTPQNIVQVIASYGGDAMKVRVFKDLTLPDAPRGTLTQYASIYYIEGA